MALDALDITGPFAPRMAEAFLAETVLSLDPSRFSAKAALTDITAILLGDSEAHRVLAEKLAAVPRERGRTPLASLLGQGIAIDTTTLEQQLGLPGDFAISPADLALWLYRDMQAARATGAASKGRRRS
jgi:hypothetical protein